MATQPKGRKRIKPIFQKLPPNKGITGVKRIVRDAELARRKEVIRDIKLILQDLTSNLSDARKDGYSIIEQYRAPPSKLKGEDLERYQLMKRILKKAGIRNTLRQTEDRSVGTVWQHIIVPNAAAKRKFKG